MHNLRAAFRLVSEPVGGGWVAPRATAAAAVARDAGGATRASPHTPRVQSSPRHYATPAPSISFEGGDIEPSSPLKRKREAAPDSLKEREFFAPRGRNGGRHVSSPVSALTTSSLRLRQRNMMKVRKRWVASSPVEIENASKRRRIDLARAVAFDARRHTRRATPGFTPDGNPNAAKFSNMSDSGIDALIRERVNSAVMEERMRMQQKERAARKLFSEENSVEGFGQKELESFDAIVLSLLLAWTRDKPRVTFDDILKCVNKEWGQGVIGRDRLLRARQFFYRVIYSAV